jgi:hypothetical protein
MVIEDIIIIAILVLIAVGICFYIRKEKKKGSKCIGCPYADSCNGRCNASENPQSINSDTDTERTPEENNKS